MDQNNNYNLLNKSMPRQLLHVYMELTFREVSYVSSLSQLLHIRFLYKPHTRYNTIAREIIYVYIQ
jgi:hypothetical protein